MIGQNEGVENEKQIVKAFNEKRIKVLSAYQKEFINQMFRDPDENTVVHANKVGGQGFKPDVEIEVNGKKHYVSVKKGGGNSVHQEKTEMFIHYCVQELDMNQEEEESLLMFLYGDGTIDGDSLPEERLHDQELIDTFKPEIEIVQKFLDRNKRNLIERFLMYGRLGKERNIHADYLYHGDAVAGIWCPLNYETIDYLVEQPNSKDSPLSIGPLTLQVWNRNLDGKPEMESRRHSIQIKWGACKSHIERINELYIHNIQKAEKERENDTKRHRVIGDNSQGFENQEKLIELINNRRVSEMVPAVKNIVTTIFPHIAASEIVRACKITGGDIKPRVKIYANGINKNLSVSMGSGNSVHQEKISNFIDYCYKELDLKREEEQAFLTIMYGDGTTDGNSSAKDRLQSTEEVKKKYSIQVEIAQNFFDRNRQSLIERFLIYGKGGKAKNIKADYIYYGTDATGRLAAFDDVVKYLIEKDGSDTALLSLGSLTTQPWNRNLSAKPSTEYKRHSLQIKWGSMKQDLSSICEAYDTNKGTSEGDWEEYELVSKLNRDKKIGNKLWETICNRLDILNLEHIYAVRVSNTVYSKLSERMVLPKSDVYLVRGNIAHEVLLDNNYWLDEDVIEGLSVTPIHGSGISCKRPNSKNFTYAKFTIKSFTSLFGNTILGAGISLFVTAKDSDLNNNVLDAWGVSETDILSYCKSVLSLNGINFEEASVVDVAVSKLIKQYCLNKTKEIIKQNISIREAIFFGKELFEEPYAASFIYTGGAISTSYIPEFSITTGSGRHKGTYTIVIKP